MLDIRIHYAQRKGYRVELLRKHKYLNQATGKQETRFVVLQSFPLKEGYPAELLTKLQPEEIMQLENRLAELKFADSLNVSPEDTTKITLHIPTKLLEIEPRLNIEAKSKDIEFSSRHAMLECWLQKLIRLQQKIDHINGFNSGILESVGVNTAEKQSFAKHLDKIDKESRPLFKALLELNQPIATTCRQLEAAAYKYGKRKQFFKGMLEEWAGIHQDKLKTLQKWLYAVAIDVLLQNNINPIGIISIQKVAEHWARQQVSMHSLSEAKQLFQALFNPDLKQLSMAHEAIESMYKKIL